MDRSLFGLVMQKVKPSALESDGTQATPQRTDETSQLADNNVAVQQSPSGSSIRSFVNRFILSSPFRFQSPGPKTHDPPPSSLQNRIIPGNDALATKRRRLDLHGNFANDSEKITAWQTAQIDGHYTNLTDWSLSESLLLQVHHKLPAWRMAPILNEGLRYWQYATADAISPAHNVLINTTSTKSSIFQGDLKSASSLQFESKLKGNTKLSSLDGAHTPVGSHQTYQWQQSFRSIYSIWSQSIECQKLDDPRQLRDLCFYCVGTDHVVLFRYDLQVATPEVLVSGASEGFSNLLTGISTLQYLMADDTFESAHSKPRSGVPDSPNIQADLEELRRAQVSGDTVGADVSIKCLANSQTKQRNNKNRSFLIDGEDDVGIFFEIYLNSFGIINSKLESAPSKIISRKLGPFLNSANMELSLRPKSTPKAATNDGTSKQEFEVGGGLILPCAIRSILALTAEHLASVKQPNTVFRHGKDRQQREEKPIRFCLKLRDGKLRSGEFNTGGNYDAENLIDVKRGTVLDLVIWTRGENTRLKFKTKALD